MAYDLDIRLPNNVRIEDVATAIAALAGHPMRMERHIDTGWAECDGVKIEPTSSPGMYQLVVTDAPGSPLELGRVFFHYEAEQGRCREISAHDDGHWIAVGIALVEFFGGEVRLDYVPEGKGLLADKDANINDVNHPLDGAYWDAFQARLAALQPLTEADVEAASRRRDALLETLREDLLAEERAAFEANRRRPRVTKRKAKA